MTTQAQEIAECPYCGTTDDNNHGELCSAILIENLQAKHTRLVEAAQGDIDIDHHYTCESTHGTGAACSCDYEKFIDAMEGGR